MEHENIALFDLDGTLCDYDKALFDKLNELKSPKEPPLEPPFHDDAPDYVKARANLIRASEDWWASIPKLQLGWDVLELAESLGYHTMILTAGPKRNPAAWSGKKKWIDKHLGEEQDVTITRDKGLVYGKILVDDYPPYIERWLKWRKNGLVIMPAGPMNKKFKHPQVIRYDGENKREMYEALKKRLEVKSKLSF